MTTGEWIAIQAERDKKNHREGKWVRCWKDEVRDCLYEMLDSRRRTAARLRDLRVELDFAYRLGLKDRRRAVQEAREGK